MYRTVVFGRMLLVKLGNLKRALYILVVLGILSLLSGTAFTMSSSAVKESRTATDLYTGYQVTGPYTTLRVKGSWIIPTANCTATPNSVSNISVIIDGIDGEGDAMEIGTYQNCVQGVAVYGAFVNIYPMTKFYGEKGNLSDLLIQPGDAVEAQGTWRTHTIKPVDWNANFVDVTKNQTVDIDARTRPAFEPILDSAALILSSDGHTLTAFSTPIDTGVMYTGVKYSDVAGPWLGRSTFGETAAMSGYNLVALQISGTTLGPLTRDGSSFQITTSAP
jgi:hypothetical protein